MNTFANSLLYLPMLALLACVLTGCVTPDFDNEGSVVRLENARSRLMLTDFYSDGVFLESTEFDLLSKQVLRRLYPQRHLEFQVRVARLPDDNAFALTTGVIVIHLGLLALLENEDQLAFVLAHEVAHIEAKHGYLSAHHRRHSRIKAQLVDILSFGSGASYAHYAAGLRKASRRQEMQADEIASRITYNAGYDLSAVASFFNLMQAQFDEDDEWQVDSTHPAHKDRRNQVVAYHRSYSKTVLERNSTAETVAAQKAAHYRQSWPSIASAFTEFRLAILPASITDKTEELAFLGALQQIDSLVELDADNSLVHCLKGNVYSGIARTDPASYIHEISLSNPDGLYAKVTEPQVYDGASEASYFFSMALREFLEVLHPGRDNATSIFVVNDPGVRDRVAANRQTYTCALRGAGLASHALGRHARAEGYLLQYLELLPAASDARYIRRLLGSGIKVLSL